MVVVGAGPEPEGVVEHGGAYPSVEVEDGVGGAMEGEDGHLAPGVARRRHDDPGHRGEGCEAVGHGARQQGREERAVGEPVGVEARRVHAVLGLDGIEHGVHEVDVVVGVRARRRGDVPRDRRSRAFGEHHDEPVGLRLGAELARLGVQGGTLGQSVQVDDEGEGSRPRRVGGVVSRYQRATPSTVMSWRSPVTAPGAVPADEAGAEEVEDVLKGEHPGEGTAAPAAASAPAWDELVELTALVVLVPTVRGDEQAPTATATTRTTIVQRDARMRSPTGRSTAHGGRGCRNLP